MFLLPLRTPFFDLTGPVIAVHEKNMQEVLATIAKDVLLEAQWLHTLSLLETIGARKIAKTMCAQGHPSLEILEHQADEARHAFIFKKLAHDLASDDNLGYLCREAAVCYFQSLDQAVNEKLQAELGGVEREINYLLVTTLIERRAMQIYPLYRSVTQNTLVRDELKTIILEESNHRVPLEKKAEQVISDLKISPLSAWLQIEDGLFTGFKHSLESAVIRENSMRHDIPVPRSQFQTAKIGC